MRSWMHSWIQSRMILQAVLDCSVSVSDDVGYSLRLQRLTAVFGCSSSCSAGCGCICQHGARDSQVCRTILVFVTTAVPMTRRGVGGSLSLCFSFCEMRLQRLTALLATQLGTGSGGRRWRSSFSFLAQAIRLGLPTSYAVNQHNFTKLVGTYFAPLHVKIKTPQITWCLERFPFFNSKNSDLISKNRISTKAQAPFFIPVRTIVTCSYVL